VHELRVGVKPTRCPTCGAVPKLSDPQRDRYFALLQSYCRHPKMMEQGVKVAGLHDYLKELYLGVHEVKRPDGRTKLVANSVSRKAGPDKVTMSEYMDRVEAWAAEMGIWETE